MNTSIYFIALLPEQALQDEITAFKREAEKQFNTKRALTSPPHVTIVSPFRFDDEHIPQVEKELESFAGNQSSFEIELKHFNCFAPRVIYVDVMVSDEMNRLHRTLNQQLEDTCSIPFQYKDREFHPHMTVAFKDLKKSVFPSAWDYFKQKTFERSFTPSTITLLKHDGQQWQIFKEFDFKG